MVQHSATFLCRPKPFLDDRTSYVFASDQFSATAHLRHGVRRRHRPADLATLEDHREYREFSTGKLSLIAQHMQVQLCSYTQFVRQQQQLLLRSNCSMCELVLCSLLHPICQCHGLHAMLQLPSVYVRHVHVLHCQCNVLRAMHGRSSRLYSCCTLANTGLTL
jgi:hypothetical protein